MRALANFAAQILRLTLPSLSFGVTSTPPIRDRIYEAARKMKSAKAPSGAQS
jgi:hypothetical protein